MSSSERARLRIGILRTDSVGEQLQPQHGDYPRMFMRLLADAGLRSEQFIMTDARTETLPAIDSADAYLITGSRHSVYDPMPWIATLAEFVEQALASHRRVVGICFGHQLLAHFFGGRVGPARSGWRAGVNRNRVRFMAPWMEPALTHFATLSSHQDQVLELPAQARLLASGPDCPVAAFELPQGALAIQGHPEFDKAYARALVGSREQLVGPQAYAEALASFAEPTTSAIVGRWIANYLTQEAAPR